MGRRKSKKGKTTPGKDIPSSGSAYFKSLENYEIVEYVRCNLVDAHILRVDFDRPANGWSATGFVEEIWQGSVRVVDRGDLSVILLVDKVSGGVTAVFPIGDTDSVERCIDSSRYFVVRVRNEEDGIAKNIAIAFNERTSAFDFNVAFETLRREKEGLLQTDEQDTWDMTLHGKILMTIISVKFDRLLYTQQVLFGGRLKRGMKRIGPKLKQVISCPSSSLDIPNLPC